MLERKIMNRLFPKRGASLGPSLTLSQHSGIIKRKYSQLPENGQFSCTRRVVHQRKLYRIRIIIDIDLGELQKL